MKKYIISGDWHIKFSRDLPAQWQLNRYQLLQEKIISLCKEHDADLILSGDVLDRSRPVLQDLNILISLFNSLNDNDITTYLISGNHEGLAEGDSTFDYLDVMKTYGIHYDHAYEIDLVEEENIRIHMLSHCTLNTSETYEFTYAEGAKHILVSHFRPNVNYFIREEIDVESLLEPYNLCIASDIHENFEADKLIYTNSPLNCSFEKEPKHGCILLTIDQGEVNVERIKLNLPNMVQISCLSKEYPPETDDYNFFRIEVTGSLTELRQIENSSGNIKVVKVPLVAESYVEGKDEENVEKPLKVELADYMLELGYEEDRIGRMFSILEAC